MSAAPVRIQPIGSTSLCWRPTGRTLPDAALVRRLATDAGCRPPPAPHAGTAVRRALSPARLWACRRRRIAI
jgi:hypothetical protein